MKTFADGEADFLDNSALKFDKEQQLKEQHLAEQIQAAEEAWKKRFYELYTDRFMKMKNSTMITMEKYNIIVEILLELESKGINEPKTKTERDYSKKYEIIGNVKGRCLYRKTKHGDSVIVPTFETAFDIMKDVHYGLAHARDTHKNKVELDSKCYGISEECLKLFLKLCPLCFPSRTRRGQSRAPLQMIYSPRFGHRAQIDLINMEGKAIQGYSYILRYVDHLSGFAHVAVCRTKDAEEVGIKLIQIISSSVIPEILQSDNGPEFVGDCIKMIKKFYDYIHIVKGRPYHPQSQGKIERGHASFKEALQKWMNRHGDNWLLGAYVVNGQINQRSMFNRGDKYSPYNFYFGKKGRDEKVTVFGEVAQQNARTEYGVLAAHLFSVKAQKIAKDRLLTKDELCYAMQKGMVKQQLQ